MTASEDADSSSDHPIPDFSPQPIQFTHEVSSFHSSQFDLHLSYPPRSIFPVSPCKRHQHDAIARPVMALTSGPIHHIQVRPDWHLNKPKAQHRLNFVLVFIPYQYEQDRTFQLYTKPKSPTSHTHFTMPEGRQSPPPERQSGRQLQDPTGSGKGPNYDKADNKDPKAQLDVSYQN